MNEDQDLELPADVLAEIAVSKHKSSNLKKEIEVLDHMIFPIETRRLEAKKFIDIQISPKILKLLSKEIE